MKSTALLILWLLTLLALQPTETDSQPYRSWSDSTLPTEHVPHRVGSDSTIPLSLYVYFFSKDHPVTNIWSYADTMLFDNVVPWVDKTDGWSAGTSRYDTLLDNAPFGRRVIPHIYYSATELSLITEASRAREVLFFPLDSSQLVAAPYFNQIRPYEFRFTQYVYDSLAVNGDEVIDESNPLEAIYDTSMGGTVVASGIAFRYSEGQHAYRWDSIYRDGAWWPTTVSGSYDSTIRSSTLFDYVSYNDEVGQRHEHREGHFIVVKGHLFNPALTNIPAVDPAEPLLRIRVYYDVDKGKDYRDSSGVLTTADTNIRFLYRQFDVLGGDLRPENPEDPEWNAYRTVLFPISFKKNGASGMGGPTDTLVTAQRIDIEVEYLGGEPVALHAVGIRDSIANLLLGSDSASDAYWDKLFDEMDDLSRSNSNRVVHNGFFTVDIADEPPYEWFLGFRKVNERFIQQYEDSDGNALAAMHGDASPHLQHLGYSDWIQKLSFSNGPSPEDASDSGRFGVPTAKVPMIPEHNGGRFSIPILFELDSLDEPGTSKRHARRSRR